MKRQRLLILLVGVLALTGCTEPSDRERELRERVAALEQQIEDGHAERLALHAYMERQAAVGRACDHPLAICPPQVARIGAEAREAGYTGASSSVYWLTLLGSFLVLVVPVVALLTGIHLAWTRIMRPAAEDLEDARASAERAKTEKKAAQEAERRKIEADKALRAVEAEIERLQADKAAQENEVEALKSAAKALRAFD